MRGEGFELLDTAVFNGILKAFFISPLFYSGRY